MNQGRNRSCLGSLDRRFNTRIMFCVLVSGSFILSTYDPCEPCYQCRFDLAIESHSEYSPCSFCVRSRESCAITFNFPPNLQAIHIMARLLTLFLSIPYLIPAFQTGRWLKRKKPPPLCHPSQMKNHPAPSTPNNASKAAQRKPSKLRNS